jgi:hypothetical protein
VTKRRRLLSLTTMAAHLLDGRPAARNLSPIDEKLYLVGLNPDTRPDPNQQPWLIEGLWGGQAVGIIGGDPETWKDFSGA